MKDKTTSDRLKEIMAKKGLKQIDILNKALPFCKKYNVKLGRNDLSQYISGKVEPGQKKLTVLAETLGVNETWLMGYDVPVSADLEQQTIIFRLTFYELLNYYKIKKEEFSKKTKIDISLINDWLNFKSLPNGIDIFKICDFFNIKSEEELFNGQLYYRLIEKYSEVLTGPDDRYKFGFTLENMIDDIGSELNISREKIKSLLFNRKDNLRLIATYDELHNFLKEYLEKLINN